MFRLRPHFANATKRLVKTPKLYFHDTGLAAYLIGCDSVDALYDGGHLGQLFECRIICESVKRSYVMAESMPCTRAEAR